MNLSRLSNQVVRLADFKKQFMDGSSLLKSGSTPIHQDEYYAEDMEEEDKSLGMIL